MFFALYGNFPEPTIISKIPQDHISHF